jgi:D-alanine-D-alanine ligase
MKALKMKIVVVHDPDLDNTQRNEANGVNFYHNHVTKSIASALLQLGHNTEICEANSSFENLLNQIKPDIAFNTSIRRFNGSSTAFAPEILEKLKIPFTGPAAFACSNAYDKQKSIEILGKAGVNVPNAFTISPGDAIRLSKDLKFPLFVKPLKGGCSQGISNISLIMNIDEAEEKINTVLQQIEKPVIVEEFLAGREFTVGMLGNKPPKILSILEFIFQKSQLPFRSYSRKMVNNEIEDEVCLAYLNFIERSTIENLAISAFEALECKDYARIDIRMDEFGDPAVLEVNAIPNLEPETSSFGLMAKYAGISFIEIIESIVNSALERFSYVKSA